MSLSSELVKMSPFLEGSLADGPDPDSTAKLGDFPIDSVIFANSDKAILGGRDFRSGRPARFAVFPKREFDLAGIAEKLRVDHPHVDPFERIETVNGHPVLVLGAVKAMPLEKVETQRRIPSRHAIRIARETLEALAAGHERGVCHGFLSSRWIWLEGSHARVRVAGLGWRLLEPQLGGDLTAFLTGRTPDLPAPEVAEGKASDHRTDLFAVGCVLYRMLTTKDPFAAESPLAAIRALAVHDPLPPSREGAESNGELDSYVLDLLARDPSKRPENAAAAASRLREIENRFAPGQGSVKPEVVTAETAAGASSGFDSSLATSSPDDSESSSGSARTAVPGHDDGPNHAEAGYALDLESVEMLPVDDAYEPISHATSSKTEQAVVRRSGRSEAAGHPNQAFDDFPIPVQWVYLADSQVEAVHLVGESQTILIRERSGRLVTISPEGEIRNVRTAPEPVKLSAADQAGNLIALVMDKTKLVLLDGDSNLIAERKLYSEPLGLAVDPLGLFVAVSFEGRETQLFTRAAKPAGKFETRQPIARMCFVPGAARLVGCTKFDQFLAVDFESEGRNQLIPEIAWARNTGVVFGHLHVIGETGKVLASCNVMGLQRLDDTGENEGTYQLGGTVIEATSDYPGRFFLASTLEGSLIAVNIDGSIIWEYERGGPWRHLAIDPLGRYALAASESGQVVSIDLSEEPGANRAKTGRIRTITAEGETSGQSLRQAAWSIRIASENDTEQGFDLIVSDSPLRVGVLDPKKALSCYLENGEEAEKVPALGGVGRLLKQRDGWIAAGNDRTLILADLARGAIHRPDLDLVQITHFDMRPTSYGLAIVQEADRLGRATVAGRWIWRTTLPATAESLVLADDGLLALSMDNGALAVLDAAGRQLGFWSVGEQEAVLVCESAGRHEGSCRWISYSRQERLLRGHGADASPLWQTQIPFQGWNVVGTGQGAVVYDEKGAATLVDDTGQMIGRRRPESGRTVYGTDTEGYSIVLRYEKRHLFLTRFDGSPKWRASVDGIIDAVALGQRGAAVLAAGVLEYFDAGI